MLRRAGVVVVAVAILLGGCAADKEPKVQDQFAELMGRPDADTAAKRYDEMRAKIRDALTNDGIAAGWVLDEGSSHVRGCLPALAALQDKEVEVRTLVRWTSPGNLPDGNWGAAVRTLADIARDYGFGEPEVVVDRPGDHEVSIRDGYGAEITFGTAKNTILGLTTGCHLTVGAHRRGTPPR